MDICVSSNFERFLFAVCGNDAAQLSKWMRDFETTGKLTLTGSHLQAAQAEMTSVSALQQVGGQDACENVACSFGCRTLGTKFVLYGKQNSICWIRIRP